MSMRIFVAALFLFLTFLPSGYTQEYGKIRALQQRAAYVVKLKNDFVANVLLSYRIPHERDAQGTVVRINIDDRWLDVTTIEIVPVLTVPPPTNGTTLRLRNWYSPRPVERWICFPICLFADSSVP